jgi:tRNA uridine 5-carboxymethylaminomethyl modification enzyme
MWYADGLHTHPCTLSADEAGIQFRVLNRSKGPAVWVHLQHSPWFHPYAMQGPRAQMDRELYRDGVQSHLKQLPLQILECSVEDFAICEHEGKHTVTEVITGMSACVF